MQHALFDNPVVIKELRGRMRGTRTPWLLFGYVLLLSLILFFSYDGWSAQHTSASVTGESAAGFTVGRSFFKVLFYSQAVMMALITPALTAGAITVEREQRTFELLRGTILRPSAIVWGKLASSVSFVALLLTSSLPLLSLCFLLGGVSPGEVFFAYLLLLGDALLFGAIGVCWSAFAATTAAATMLSYATMLLFFAVTFPFAVPTFDDSGTTPNVGLCALNPIGAVTGAVIPEHYYGWTLPAWVPALLLNGTLTALLVLAAINSLEDFPARRAVHLRWITLLFAGMLIFFGDGVVAGLPLWSGVSMTGRLALDLEFASVLLLLIVPVLVTGNADDSGNETKQKGWSIRAVFSEATLASGLPLALLLTLVVVGVTFAASHFAAQPPRLLYFATPSNRFTRFALSQSQTDAVVRQAGTLLLAVVVGISGLGFLLSVIVKNRWVSLIGLYLVLLFAIVPPYYSYGLPMSQEEAAGRNPAANLLYLCPLVPIMQLTDRLDSRPSFGRDNAVPSMFGYGYYPLWIGTSLIYVTIGLASYLLAIKIQRRQTITQSA